MTVRLRKAPTDDFLCDERNIEMAAAAESLPRTF